MEAIVCRCSLKGSIDVKIEASYCQAPLELHLLHAAGGQGGLRLVPGLQLLPDQTQLPGGALQPVVSGHMISSGGVGGARGRLHPRQALHHGHPRHHPRPDHRHHSPCLLYLLHHGLLSEDH